MSRYSLPLVSVMFMTLLLCGCMRSSMKYGNQIDETKVQKIEKGKTTGEEILGWFGSPTNKSTGSDGTTTFTFLGSEYKSKANILGAYGLGDASSTTTSTKTLTVTLRNNVVEDYRFTTN